MDNGNDTLLFQTAICSVFKGSLANTLSGKPSLIFLANNTDKNIPIVDPVNAAG